MSPTSKISATEEEAKPVLVPKLRFPEFRGAEGWKPYFLEELEDLGWVELGRGEVISGQDIKAIPGEYPIYSSSVKNNGLMGAYGRFMFDEELISWSIDGGGDFFHRPRHKFSVTNVSGYMRLNTSHLSYRFLASHLQALHGSLTFDYQFKAHPSVIRKLYRLAIPSPAEQQKIAECLSSVDELIAAQARKVDALKTHKKGLMQQLFPREGETQPRLRFPEFQNAGEWEVRTIGDMFDLVNGCAFKPEDWKSSGTPIIRIQNLNDPSAEFNYSQEPVPERNRVEPGDLLFAWSGTLGSSFGARIWNGPSGVLNQHIFKVLMDEKEIALNFALLVLAKVEEDIARRTHGFKASFVHVKKSDLVKVELLLPTLPEQHRIASCLSSLDALITGETQKHEALKTHKRGLMQQLFPSPEEATP